MSLPGFAFGAGVLATVSPCGFAMLPAFLGYQLHAEQPPTGSRESVLGRVGRGLRVGVAVSSGFAGVFVAAGLLIALGLRVAYRQS